MDAKEAQQKGEKYQEWASTDPVSLVAAAQETVHDLSPSEREKFAPLIESVRRFDDLQRALQGTNIAGSQIPSQR